MIEMFFCIFLIASNHIFRTRCIFMVLYLNIVQSWKFLTVFQNKMTITMLYFFLLLRNFFSQGCTLYIDSFSKLLLFFGPEEISMHLYRRAVQALKMIWKKCFGHYVNTVPFYYSLNLLRAVGNAHKWYEAIIPNHFKNVNNPT